MDKQDIVVGGIYRFKSQFLRGKDAYDGYKITKSYPNGTHMIELLNSVYTTLTIAVIEALPPNEQIGYDATYSDEYKQIKSEIAVNQKVIEAAALVRENLYKDQEIELYNRLGVYMGDLLTDRDQNLTKLNAIAIKAKSWMKEDSDES